MEKQNFIEDQLVILSKQTIDAMLATGNFADINSVYVFYYYTAKWQKTNQIKATTSYVAKGIGMGEKRVRAAKKQLAELGLIEDVRAVNKTTGSVENWFIKINYIWREETHPVKSARVDKKPTLSKPTLSKTHSVENGQTNALSVNSLNALSDNNKNALNAYTDEDVELSHYLLERVRANFPFVRDVATTKDFVEMNRLHRIDGFSYTVIRGVIDWAVQDSFWRGNIRSVFKLRKQFVTLLVKIQSNQVNNAVVTV